MSERQMRLTRPNREPPSVERLTERQRDLLRAVRAATPVNASSYTARAARLLGYADPLGALRRLERRGLVYRVRGRGLASVWRARTNGERPA